MAVARNNSSFKPYNEKHRPGIILNLVLGQNSDYDRNTEFSATNLHVDKCRL